KDLRIHQITVDRQMDSVGERINAIEKKVDTDRAKIYDALSSIRKNLADSGADSTISREQLQKIQGDIEKLQKDVADLNRKSDDVKDLRDRIDGISFKVNSLEKSYIIDKKEAGEGETKGKQHSIAAPTSEKETAYAAAYDLFIKLQLKRLFFTGGGSVKVCGYQKYETQGDVMKKIATSLLFFFFVILVYPPTMRGEEAGGNIEVCKACHQDRYNSYSTSIHANKGINKSPANAQGCESCHDQGMDHIQKGGGKGTGMFSFSDRKADAAAKSAKCLNCHADSRSLSHWDISIHKSADVACSGCHSVHSGKKMDLKASQPDLCISCHRELRIQISKQSHHPIREGKVKCTDCHDQHGSFGNKMVKASSINELCYKCHAEMRGPFLREHPPVAENCSTCHTVHGSNHGKLLTNRVPQLCQSCHDASGHPSSIYTKFNTFQGSSPSNRMFARSCLNCHSAIHGSMDPSSRGEFFIR
ncbi:MAG: DmsE family decaheme c-type cytochrome, partial [Syntrophales bacterium]